MEKKFNLNLDRFLIISELTTPCTLLLLNNIKLANNELATLKLEEIQFKKKRKMTLMRVTHLNKFNN